MITVHADTITTTFSLIRIGCVVRGPEDAWIRFAVLEIDAQMFTPAVLQGIALAYSHAQSDQPEDETLF